MLTNRRLNSINNAVKNYNGRFMSINNNGSFMPIYNRLQFNIYNITLPQNIGF